MSVEACQKRGQEAQGGIGGRSQHRFGRHQLVPQPF